MFLWKTASIRSYTLKLGDSQNDWILISQWTSLSALGISATVARWSVFGMTMISKPVSGGAHAPWENISDVLPLAVSVAVSNNKCWLNEDVCHEAMSGLSPTCDRRMPYQALFLGSTLRFWANHWAPTLVVRPGKEDVALCWGVVPTGRIS